MHPHDGAADVYRVQRYVDNELSWRELLEFSAHLRICQLCRELVEKELALSALLRQARPLYWAPESLRERVAHILCPNGNFFAKVPGASHRLFARGKRQIRKTLRAAADAVWRLDESSTHLEADPLCGYLQRMRRWLR